MEWAALTPPEYIGSFAYCSRGEYVYIIGGYDGSYRDEVYRVKYDTWEALTPLTTALQGSFPNRAAVVGDWAYFAGAASTGSSNRFWRYHLDTGSLEELTPPASLSTDGYVAIDGLVYSLGPTSRVYDPDLDSWSSAPGTPTPSSACRAAAWGSSAVVVESGSTNAYLYTPGTGTWAALPALPGSVSGQPNLAVLGDTAYVLAWTGSALTSVTLDLTSPVSWDAWDAPPHTDSRFGIAHSGMVSAALGDGDGVYVFGRTVFPDELHVAFYGDIPPAPKVIEWEATATLTASATMRVAGKVHLTAEATLAANAAVAKGPSATLSVTAGVEYPFATQDAFLNVTADITGGPGQHTDLLVTFTTGRIAVAPLAVMADIVADAEAALLLEPSEPSDDPEVVHAVVYGGNATSVLALEVLGCDSYGFDWPLNGAVTGSATAYGEAGDPQPDIDLPIDSAGALSLAWELHGDIVATREFDSDTLALLNSAALPELVPVYVGAGDDPDCLYDLTATLCEVELVTRCAIIGLLPSVLPTRGELCVQACEQVGVALFITPGPGIPGLDWLVGHDYRTRGKSPLAVVQELLLDGGAPMWASPGALFVSGSGLPEAGAFTADRDVISGEARTEQNAYPDDEPVLSDFTKHCGTEVDPCNGDTFETMPTATLEWVEETIPAAPSFMPTRIEHKITKLNGRITIEEATHYGPYRAPAGPSSQWAWGWVQTVRTEYAYLNCCPEALAFTEETIHVRKTLDQAPGFSEAGYLGSEALTWYRAMPETYLHSHKSVQQTWHAEGWLRSRIETSKTFDGWQFQGDIWSEGSLVTATPTYSEAGHEQQYVPIGKGMWHVHTQNRDTILVPFREIDATAATVDIVGSNRTRATAAFTVVTDSAPPTVTCSEVCGPEGTCMELAEAEFVAAHARWEAIRTAQLLNEPEGKRVVTKTYQGRRLSLPGGLSPIPARPGAYHPDGMIARVSWAGQGPRTGTPGETTTVEYWSAEAGS